MASQTEILQQDKPNNIGFLKNSMPSCPNCHKTKQVVKTGTRRTREGKVQRYLCKSCNHTFTDRVISYVTYQPKIIFAAISTYNLGYTLEETEEDSYSNPAFLAWIL
jgi:transposase-like protein